MGLFGKKRRSSADTSDALGEAVLPTQSAVVSTATTSTTSARPSSVRKPPIRPQATFERVTPPPVKSTELELLRDQISDLERSFNDRDLFDFLLADIDRNRLTQIVTIFADAGRYIEMQGAMELAETLDGLIKRRLDETHEQQRRNLIVSQPIDELDIHAILSEAEATDVSKLSEQEIQTRISYFDFHFYRFQDSEFELLLRLSERIETFRKALRDIESRCSLQSATPDEAFQPQGVLTESIETTQLPQSNSRDIQIAASDDEAWETFTPAPETAPAPPLEINECASIYGPIGVLREDTQQPIPESIVTDNQETSLEHLVFTNIQDGTTDTWEQFHNDSLVQTDRPVEAPDQLSMAEVDRISSTCEPKTAPESGPDEPSYPEFVASKESRLTQDILAAWLRIIRESQSYTELSEGLRKNKTRHLLRNWCLIARNVRERREEDEETLKRSVLLALRQNQESGVERMNQMILTHNMKMMRDAFNCWIHGVREETRLIDAYQSKRVIRLIRSVLHEWRTLNGTKQGKIAEMVHLRDTVMKRSTMTAWRVHVDSRNTRANEFYTRSLLNKFACFVKELRKSKEERLTVQKRVESLRTGSIFKQWRGIRERRRRVAVTVLDICSANIRSHFEQLRAFTPVGVPLETRIAAIDSIFSVVSVALLRDKRATFGAFIDPVLLVATPRGHMELFSPSMHKSPIVQYYSISDPEEARQETPPPVGPIEDLKQTTNDIIVKTQIFLSQRRLKSVSPPIESPTNCDHSRKVADWLESHKRSSDNYFTDFERKWAIEEQKWHL